MLKRAFDITMAMLGLLLIAPVLAAIAVWIRLDSPGPALFRQQRIGRFGAPFRIHKFRTMRHAAVGAEITAEADTRITRAGAWLRRRKLDELPQLIDVLLGDMSLVGPRPEVPRYVALYPVDLRDKLLSVRPGITDLASIEFRREAELLATAADPERAYIEQVLPEKLRLASRYVDTVSFWGDLRLIVRTLAALMTDAPPRGDERPEAR